MEAAPAKVQKNLLVSFMAENLSGSQILRIASEINEKIKNGEKIYNLTIGDFNPHIFPIPEMLKAKIAEAFNNDLTNYPPANGLPALRNAITEFNAKKFSLDYNAEDIVIGAGARPLVFAAYETILDPGDYAIFPVPSWNNNFYCHICDAKPIVIETTPENYFMPSPAELKPHIHKANMIALCSPLNPTGTVLRRKELSEICEMVLEENEKRDPDQKPLYILYDQVYSLLTFHGNEHFHPAGLYPEMKDYTIYIDGISKSFAATGVRVGWAYGPSRVIAKMKAFLSHMGAFAPTALQQATAEFLKDDEAVNSYLSNFHDEINVRLDGFYDGFKELKKEGFPVDAIEPEAAIYLTIDLNIKGLTTAEGLMISTSDHITEYILNEAKVALVPFSAFGASPDSTWFRLSVGTCRKEDVKSVIDNLRSALSKLT